MAGHETRKIAHRAPDPPPGPQPSTEILLGAFVYLHLTLSRLWRIYGLLHQRGETIDGLPFADRIAPWMLANVIEDGHHGFRRPGRATAIFFGWGFLPITIFALGYRYLRAHYVPITALHAILIALAIVSAFEFWRQSHVESRGRVTPPRRALATMSITVLGLGLFGGSQHLITRGYEVPDALRFLTTNAQLCRAKLSIRPPGWQAKWRENERAIAVLNRCEGRPEDDVCYAKLKTLQTARKDLLDDLTPAALGHEEA